jgi:hypothetical protein
MGATVLQQGRALLRKYVRASGTIAREAGLPVSEHRLQTRLTLVICDEARQKLAHELGPGSR